MKYGQVATKKLYYSISEVSERTGIAPHVLRYWEGAFPMLRPKKNRAGNRAYRESDIRLLERIREMLQEKPCSLSVVLQKMLSPAPQEAVREEPASIAGPVASGGVERRIPNPEVLKGLREELLRTLAALRG